MKKRSILLKLAAAVLVFGSGAMQARGGGVPLSSLLGTTVDYGGFAFSFETYANGTGNAPASAVIVNFVGAGTSAVGFTLDGSFGAAIGASNDSDLVYQVAGVSLTDATLVGNPAGTGTGVASVTETIRAGAYPGGLTGPILGDLFISNTSTVGPVMATFADTPVITVNTDIETIGGTAGVSLGSVGQTFSVSGFAIPEPASMYLLGIGMVGFFAFGRFFQRSALP
jgi:hypothetical protein